MDAAGNIYMAGSTLLSDYPTTPGVYQPVFPRVMICYGLCQLTLPGTNQYLTKVDPTGTKLIYSTAVPGTGQTANAGLVVDASGNAYLTGLAYADYPYTVPPPQSPEIRPFLTKLDPLAQHAVYSVDIGGAGVALDGNGHVFTGGSYNNANLSGGLPIPSELLPAPPPATSPVPMQCRENDVTTASQAYVSEIDAASGNVLSTVLVDASNLAATSIALAGSSVWLTGAAQQADVPITPGALAPFPLTAGPLPGGYLGAADFSSPAAASAPVVACVLDAANTARTSPVAPNQLLTLMGSNLGPAQGVSGGDSATTSLGGVSVAFDGNPATILFASASQINVAVPLSVAGQNSTVMQVSVNGVPGPVRVLPVVSMTPSLFANLTTVFQNCANIGTFDPAVFVPVAQYADGSANSCQHPAKPGTVVSFFLNGLGLQGNASSFGPFSGQDIPVVARVGAWSAEVVGVTPASPFVWRVDVAIPPLPPGTGLVQFNVVFAIESEVAPIPVGPIGVGADGRPWLACRHTHLGKPVAGHRELFVANHLLRSECI